MYKQQQTQLLEVHEQSKPSCVLVTLSFAETDSFISNGSESRVLHVDMALALTTKWELLHMICFAKACPQYL